MRIISENSYLTDKELVAKYKKLAPKADRRLARIESAVSRGKSLGIEKWAYTEAKNKVKNIIGLSDGRPRFDRSIKNLSRGQKEAMVGHVEHFLASKTSSLREYNKSWKQGLTTFNKNNKMNLTMAEYRELWESEEFRKLAEEFGSGDALESVREVFDQNMSMSDAISLAVFNRKLKTAYKDIINPLDKEMQKLTEQYNNLYGNFDKDLKEAEDFNKVMLGIQYRTSSAEFDDILKSLSDKELLLFEGQLIKWRQEDAVAVLNELKK